MAWLCKDLDGAEWISTTMPVRDEDSPTWMCLSESNSGCDEWDGIELPEGTIKKILGRDITWYDEPINMSNYATRDTYGSRIRNLLTPLCNIVNLIEENKYNVITDEQLLEYIKNTDLRTTLLEMISISRHSILDSTEYEKYF